MFDRALTPIPLLGILAFVLVATAWADNPRPVPEKSTVLSSLGDSPLAFTKNLGQWPDSILYRANASGATMWFTKNGIWYQFFRTVERSSAAAAATDPAADIIQALPGKFNHDHDSIETAMIKAEFVGASETVEVMGLEEQQYTCNYFIGNDHSKWRTEVPNYSALTMHGLYPGVDVTCSAIDGRLNLEMAAFSADELAQVKVEYRGTISAVVQRDNFARVQTSLGEHRFNGVLLADQPESDSRTQCSPAPSSADAVSLVYSTYLGGGNSENEEGGIATDVAGNAYVTGGTYSANFPTQSPFQASNGGIGYTDAFITKIGSSGVGLIYSTYLGGSGYDRGLGIVVDSGGNAYVTGVTASANFPTLNPFQSALGSIDTADAFVTKFNSVGTGLIYSTYLGANGADWSVDIAADAEGNAFVMGNTQSANFPTQNPFQASIGSLDGNYDAFVSKFNSTGSGLIYSTFLGGADYDQGTGIALDVHGNAYVTGYTYSTDFPTQNPFQASFVFYVDAFVTKFNTTGNGLVYSTYLGGNDEDYCYGVAVDSSGNAYMTGRTNSTDFPIENAFQPVEDGYSDAFVTKLNSVGSGLVYSTYLGGSSGDYDYANDIAVDAAGNAYITGRVNSEDFPVQDPYQMFHGGYDDAFVTKLNSAGTGLVYSTFLGGSDDEFGTGIAIDAGGSAYVMGRTYSANFPLQNPLQASMSGFNDVFVTKLNAYPCCIGATGNVDCDAMGQVDVGDLTTLVDNLFINFTPLCCDAEANCDGIGGVDVGDLTALIHNLFINFTPLAACQ